MWMVKPAIFAFFNSFITSGVSATALVSTTGFMPCSAMKETTSMMSRWISGSPPAIEMLSALRHFLRKRTSSLICSSGLWPVMRWR